MQLANPTTRPLKIGRWPEVPTVPLSKLLAWTTSADIDAQPIRSTCLNHLSTNSNKLFEYAMAGLPGVASDSLRDGLSIPLPSAPIPAREGRL